MKCEKCGCTAFFVEETVRHLVIDNEIVRTDPGEIGRECCVRCTAPTFYEGFLAGKLKQE